MQGRLLFTSWLRVKIQSTRQIPAARAGDAAAARQRAGGTGMLACEMAGAAMQVNIKVVILERRSYTQRGSAQPMHPQQRSVRPP
mmetsp:Transcript_12340/g.35496  ORF Transcript_12340/g.35496 Transcript_12340/m.35496 type:complete len:85 (-) Transcript_12340:654-908(-)